MALDDLIGTIVHCGVKGQKRKNFRYGARTGRTRGARF